MIPNKNGTYLADCRSNVALVAIQIRKGCAYWGEKFDRPVPANVLAKVREWRRIRFSRQAERSHMVAPPPLVKLPTGVGDGVINALNRAGVPWQIDPLAMLQDEFDAAFNGTLFTVGGREKAFAMFCKARGLDVA